MNHICDVCVPVSEIKACSCTDSSVVAFVRSSKDYNKAQKTQITQKQRKNVRQ